MLPQVFDSHGLVVRWILRSHRRGDQLPHTSPLPHSRSSSCILRVSPGHQRPSSTMIQSAFRRAKPQRSAWTGWSATVRPSRQCPAGRAVPSPCRRSPRCSRSGCRSAAGSPARSWRADAVPRRRTTRDGPSGRARDPPIRSPARRWRSRARIAASSLSLAGGAPGGGFGTAPVGAAMAGSVRRSSVVRAPARAAAAPRRCRHRGGRGDGRGRWARAESGPAGRRRRSRVPATSGRGGPEAAGGVAHGRRGGRRRGSWPGPDRPLGALTGRPSAGAPTPRRPVRRPGPAPAPAPPGRRRHGVVGGDGARGVVEQALQFA